MSTFSYYGSAVTVFRCELDIHTHPLNEPFVVTWDLYAVDSLSKRSKESSFIRTVCHSIVPVSTGNTVKRVNVSGIAYLNSDNPKEFNVVVGIKKSFANFVSSLGRHGNPSRETRVFIWYYFNRVFGENFFEKEPYGAWKYDCEIFENKYRVLGVLECLNLEQDKDV